jgi:hypothetical protein
MSNFLSAYEEINDKQDMQQDESFFISITYLNRYPVKSIKDYFGRSRTSIASSTSTTPTNIPPKQGRAGNAPSPSPRAMTWLTINSMKRLRKSRRRSTLRRRKSRSQSSSRRRKRRRSERERTARAQSSS